MRADGDDRNAETGYPVEVNPEFVGGVPEEVRKGCFPTWHSSGMRERRRHNSASNSERSCDPVGSGSGTGVSERPALRQRRCERGRSNSAPHRFRRTARSVPFDAAGRRSRAPGRHPGSGRSAWRRWRLRFCSVACIEARIVAASPLEKESHACRHRELGNRRAARRIVIDERSGRVL